MFRKPSTILFVLIIFLGFIVRLYRFDNPLADWHSWRQADVSSVSRNFVKHGFDLYHPKMNNISNVQSGFENPNGYFYAEFPIYDAVQAGLFMLFGHLTIEEWGRLVTIFTSLAGFVFLFLIVKKRNKLAGWFVLIFSVFLPFNIYYGRTILPEPSMITMLLGGIYFFDRWIESLRPTTNDQRPNMWLVLSLLFAAIALLLKPYAIFYFMPLLVLAFSKFGWKLFIKWELWVFAILAIAPIVWWRYFILRYPEGIPVSGWLLNGNGIRFRPAFFRWIFYERLTKLISGYFNVIFVALGIAGFWKEKDKWFLLSFIISALAYVCIIATGNVQHDYYQITIIPAVVILMGYGTVLLINFIKKFAGEKIAIGIAGIIIFLGFYFSWQQVKDYFNINNPAIIEAGKAVNRLTPENAKVLAPYDGDSSFLYQTNRQGWASFEHDLPTMIKMGADYLVLVNPKPGDEYFAKTYKVISRSKNYLLVKLK